MARDFDNAGEVVEIPHYAEMGTLTQWSWSIWSLRRSAGSGDNRGRLVDKPHRWFAFHNPSHDGYYSINTSWTEVDGQWRFDLGPTNVWVHHLITYDGSNTSNDPAVYRDGQPLTVTRLVSPSGTYGNETLPAAIGIGNVPTFINRAWDGLHAEFALWNRVLTPGEAALVYLRGPLAVPDGLVCYVPLYGTQSPEPNYISPENPGTVIGATGAAHPTIVLPWGVDLVTPPFVPSEGGTEVAAVVEVESDAAAALRATRRVQASIESETDAAVEAAIARLLASVAEVEPDAAPTIRPTRRLAGQLEAETDVRAQLLITALLQLAATLDGEGDVAASLRVARHVSGVAEAESGLDAGAEVRRHLSATLEGDADAVIFVHASRRVAAALEAEADVVPVVHTIRAVDLSALLESEADSTAELRVGRAIAAALEADGDASAEPLVARHVALEIAGEADVAAVLVASRAVAAQLEAEADVAAELATIVVPVPAQNTYTVRPRARTFRVIPRKREA